MTHIMHLIESLEFGGAEKVVVHYANKLSLDYELSICLTKRKGELLSELSDRVNVYCLESPEGNNYHLPFKIRQLIREKNVDILHSHDWGVYLEAAIAINKTPCKLIHTVHGPYMSYANGFIPTIKKNLRHFAEKMYSKRIFKIVSVSNSIQNYIIKDIGINPRRLKTIHNGIGGLHYKTKSLQKHTVRFVTTGRLAAIKNYTLLLDAFKEVFKTRKDFYLTIVGDGPEKKMLQDYSSKLKLDDNVNFLGFRNDVKDILAKNDVFVMSSRYEGISISLLESMSLAIPAIATSVGGIPETIINNETGYLVSLDDYKSYANKIKKFIAEPKLINKLGLKAKKHFENEFHENVVLEKYKLLYKQCMEL